MRKASVMGRTCGVLLLGLALALAMFQPAQATVEAWGEEYVIRGLVYESDDGIVLAGEDEVIYRLEGLDMGPYLESVVEVVGQVAENEFGEAVILVSSVSLDENAGESPQSPNETAQ
ncbi:MAG: hypothetical protein KKE73_16195 [Proteobacteria bacterium]|nr:hypothetical protein [Pseudomonadota bacterium]